MKRRSRQAFSALLRRIRQRGWTISLPDPRRRGTSVEHYHLPQRVISLLISLDPQPDFLYHRDKFLEVPKSG